MTIAGDQALCGWAEADMTPPLGFPMGGRGPVFDPAEQIADPLLAQVTVLQDQRGRRVVLVSLDILGSTPSVADPIRHQLAAIAGVTPEAVVLNYSHTHSMEVPTFTLFAPSALFAPYKPIRHVTYAIIFFGYFRAVFIVSWALAALFFAHFLAGD